MGKEKGVGVSNLSCWLGSVVLGLPLEWRQHYWVQCTNTIASRQIDEPRVKDTRV